MSRSLTDGTEVEMPGRAHLLARLLQQIRRLPSSRPALVAIDGPDAAGKTTLANELATMLSGASPVIRASIDGFHRPRQARYRRGPLSPEGYYEDSFDDDALRGCLLVPLRSGDRRVVPAVFDLQADAPVSGEPIRAPANSILLFDGVFLQRTELRRYWDLAIYLHIDEQEVLRRALDRDLALFGSPEEVERRYRARYLPGQAIYRSRVDPMRSADIVVDNTVPAVPKILKWPAPRKVAADDEGAVESKPDSWMCP